MRWIAKKEKKMTKDDINNIFTYHKPFGNQTTRYRTIRGEARKVACCIEVLCPDSREKSLAITNLQQAIMWANASIAINEKEPQGDGLVTGNIGTISNPEPPQA